MAYGIVFTSRIRYWIEMMFQRSKYQVVQVKGWLGSHQACQGAFMWMYG